MRLACHRRSAIAQSIRRLPSFRLDFRHDFALDIDGLPRFRYTGPTQRYWSLEALWQPYRVRGQAVMEDLIDETTPRGGNHCLSP